MKSIDQLGDFIQGLDEVTTLAAVVSRIQQSGTDQLAANPYERQKARSRQYQQSKSALAREIGPLPPVRDPERKAACRDDPGLYLKTYNPNAFPLEWSDDHLILIKRAEIVIKAGAMFALAMPRGSGKTTCVRHLVEWALNYGWRRFAMLVGANKEKGAEAIEYMISNYESNLLLLEDFPEIVYPLHQLDGIHNKAKGQTLNGERTRIEFRKNTLVLPTVAGSEASGAVLKGAGIKGALRGNNHRLRTGEVLRPDLLVPDDPQTRESAESPPQTRTRIRILTSDLLASGGPGGEIAALMPCTVIVPGDAADTLLDNEKHPEWRGLRTSMMPQFPERMDLWEQYWDIFTRELIASLSRLTDRPTDEDLNAVPSAATDFYRARRTAMDKEAYVSWPQRHRKDELSGIQHAMNLFFRDEAAFFSEYQNDPRDPHADEQLLSAKQVAAKTNSYARGEIPIGVEWLTLAVDCHKRGLVWMLCGFEWDFTGYGIDWGVFPEQPRESWRIQRLRPTLKMKYPGSGDQGALYKGLRELVDSKLQHTFLREDGVEMRIAKGLIDQQYEGATVKRAIRECGWSNLMYPAIGRGIGPNQIPISQFRKRAGETIGEEWLLKKGQGRLRDCHIDTYHWKSFAWKRLLTGEGDPGCFTWFGFEPATANRPRRKANHDFLATHITAEKRDRLIGDRVVDVWSDKPNSENHGFDTFVYCHVAGSMCGARATPVRETEQKSTPKRSLSERRAAKRKAK